MILLDGKTLSQQILSDLKLKIENLKLKINLDILLVGDDPSSLKYVSLKQTRASEIGIGGQLYHLPATSTKEQILSQIDKLNNSPDTTAFFIQLPIPNFPDPSVFINSISPKKDADGLTAVNLGLLFHQHPLAIAPATALGIIRLLKNYQIDLVGKNVVIINDSPIVGLPLLALFNTEKSTVTICHRQTKNLSEFTKNADIIVSATGVKNLITAEMVKDGVVAVDVGGGDIDFDGVSAKSSYITPTFGGVGPMTVASLLENTVTLATRI